MSAPRVMPQIALCSKSRITKHLARLVVLVVRSTTMAALPLALPVFKKEPKTCLKRKT